MDRDGARGGIMRSESGMELEGQRERLCGRDIPVLGWNLEASSGGAIPPLLPPLPSPYQAPQTSLILSLLKLGPSYTGDRGEELRLQGLS